MSGLTWREAAASLSYSDREMLSRIHAVEADQLEQRMLEPGRWNRALQQQHAQTQALVQRIRRAGGHMPASFVEAMGGPLRTNVDALSPHAFLSIYEALSPLESAYAAGLLWPVRFRDGKTAWTVLPEIEQDMDAVPPLFEHVDRGEAIVGASFDLDEVLLVFASQVRVGGVVLARGGRLPQRVLQPAAIRGANADVMQWLLAVCLAGHAMVVGAHGLAIGPTMEEWLRADPHIRRQEMLRAWLGAAWDDWQRTETPRTKSIDMRLARRSMAYALLPHIPEEWVSGEACLHTIRLRWPDVVRPVIAQRRWIAPSGWLDRWDVEDGAVVRLNLCGPLRWLGCVEWDETCLHVRRTKLGSWISGLLHIEAKKEDSPVIFEDDYSLLLRDSSDLWARYQLDWIGEARDAVTWQLSPRMIQRAVAAGMPVEAIAEVLDTLTGKPVSRDIRQELALWAGSVAVVRVSQVCVVRTQNAAALDDVLHDRRVGLRDGQRLNETTYAIPLDAHERVVRALQGAGYAVHAPASEKPTFRDAELRFLEQAVRAYRESATAREVLHKIALLRSQEQRDG